MISIESGAFAVRATAGAGRISHNRPSAGQAGKVLATVGPGDAIGVFNGTELYAGGNFGVRYRYVRRTDVTKWMRAILAASVVTVGCGSSARDAADGAAPASDDGALSGAARKAAAAVGIPTYREITLPAGTTLPLELKSAVASDTSRVEDTVRATLRRGITIDGRQVLPAGTEVVGAVTQAERAGRVKGRARVAFRFTSLRHDGERYDIRTDSVVRVAEATKSEDATKIAIGAGAGAAAAAGGGGGLARDSSKMRRMRSVSSSTR